MLAGTWHVWSPGPQTGSWWLKPVDEDALALARELKATPSRGEPVILTVAQGCIAVRSRDVRPGGR